MSRLGRTGIRLRHPAQFVVAGFAAGITIGTLLLMLPVATTGPGGAPPVTALFTATSAMCVTGLVVVDTPTYWSGFGEAVILLLIQVGGFGIMTGSALLAMLVARRLSLRTRMAATAEAGALNVGDIRQVVRRVATFAAVFEGVAFVILTFRWWIAYDVPFGRAAYLGLFHAVSAYNNAGFGLFSDNLIPFAGDAVMLLTLGAVIIAGGLGFPVLHELRTFRLDRRHWSLHTRVTLFATAVLILVPAIVLSFFEWSNTFDDFGAPMKAVLGLFHSITARTAGFNAVDYEAMHEESLFVTTVLMFIGGGSASTAGGIKVTTFALLGFVIWSELRGEPDVNLFARRAPTTAQRQALTVALLGVAVVVVGTLALLVATRLPLGPVLFEATSAFGTVGLSRNLTPELPTAARLILVALMFIGRLGPHTFGAALSLREQDRLYRFPEERPIIG